MSDLLNGIDRNMLEAVADLHKIPDGAYNIRKNGERLSSRSTDEIEIVPKKDKSGIDIIVKPGVKNRSVHIPVIITETGLSECVYNDFYIGEGADVLIVAGCGIHNCGAGDSEHDGIHCFHIEKGAKVKYVEKHYGEGDGLGKRILNPTTEVYMEPDSVCEMEMIQIKGVDSTHRSTVAHIKENTSLQILERLMTHGKQHAISDMKCSLDGDGSKLRIVSRSIARDGSTQVFHPVAEGNALCHAHIQCDSIIMDKAHISSIPEIAANHPLAEIIHEAAIGRINNDQLLKLRTLGLSEEEAEAVIIEGFLK